MYKLEYMEELVSKEADSYHSMSHHGKVLYERATMRVFVDGRRVETPFGFSGEVETPRDVGRRLFPVRFQATSDHELPDMIFALDGERERGREVVLEHEVDDAIARYRLVEVEEEYSEDGDFDVSLLCELVEGEPVIHDESGERVDVRGDGA